MGRKISVEKMVSIKMNDNVILELKWESHTSEYD
jgi:hypothetical protein